MDEENEVYYCKVCLSLAILGYGDDTMFCNECGNTDIGVASFEDWDRMYREKYGRPYMETKRKKS